MSTTLRSGICEGNGKGGFAEVWRKTRLSPCWVCIEQVQDCHLALDRAPDGELSHGVSM